MPITKRQFELGVDPEIQHWMKEIYSRLSKHKNEAFTYNELWGLAGVPALTSVPPSFDYALGKLLGLNVVETRTVKGASYYTLGTKKLEEHLVA